MFQTGESTPGFDDPIGLLRACHRRIRERLDLLERLPEYLDTHGPDASARSAAQNVLNYFERAAVDHHEDEEEDLFPLLLATQGRPGWNPVLPETLDQLAQEHRKLAWHWAQAEPALTTLARGQVAPDLRLAGLLHAYRAHMAVEEELVFPLATRLLTADELARMGGAMRSRRGLSPDPGGD